MLLKISRILCKTATDPTCKARLKAKKVAAKVLFKGDKAAINAACKDVNLVASCNVFCNTGVEPVSCEAAFSP